MRKVTPVIRQNPYIIKLINQSAAFSQKTMKPRELTSLQNPILNTMPIGVAVIDPALRVREFNSTWAETIAAQAARQPAEISTSQFFFDLLPEQKELLQTELKKVLSGRTLLYPDPDSGCSPPGWGSVFMPIWKENVVISILHLTLNLNGQAAPLKADPAGMQPPDDWQQVFQDLLTTASDGIWDWEISTRRLSIAEDLYSITGFSHQDAPSNIEGWLKLFEAEEQHKLEENYKKTIQGGTGFVFSCENQLRTKNGRKLWVANRGVVLRDPQGNPWRILGNSKDITEAMASRHALQQRMEYEALIARIVDIFATQPAETLDDSINETLGMVGEFFGVDRSFLFLLIENNEFLEIAYEWSRPGLLKLREMKISLPSSEKEEAIQRLIQGETLSIASSNTPGPNEPRIHGHKSGTVAALLAVPMLHQGVVNGCIGLAQENGRQDWEEDHSSLLKIISEIISNALEQRKIAEFQTGQQRYLELVATQTGFLNTIHSLVELLESQHPGMKCLIFGVDKLQQRLSILGAGHLPDEFIQAVDGLEISPSTGSAAATCLSGRRTIVEDVHHAPCWEKILPLAVKFNIQAAWAEPIYSPSGELVGALSQYYPKKRGPNPSEIKTIEMTAHLAGLVIERNRSQIELQKAYQTLENRVEERTRELTTLFEISRQISTTLELTPLLSQMIQLMRRIIEFTAAAVLILEDKKLVYRAYQGPIAENSLLGASLPCTDQILSQVFAANTAGVIPDILEDTPLARIYWQLLTPQYREEFSYVRCWMGVPLMIQGRQIGLLTLHHHLPNHFTQQHIELATTFAAQSAAAIENAHLFAQTRRQAEETQAILTVQQAISSRLDLSQVMQIIADEARRLVQADVSAFQMISEQSIFISAISGGPESLIGYRLLMDDSISGMVVQEKKALRLFDASQNPHLNQGLAALIHLSALMIVPLINCGEVIGMIAVTSEQPGAFSAEDERILTMLATYAVVGVENARLYAITKQQADESLALLNVQHAISSRLELEDVINIITKEAMHLTAGKMTCLCLLEQGALSVRSIAGDYPLQLGQVLPLNNSVIGTAIKNQASIICNNTADEQKANPFLVVTTRIKSLIIVPLVNMGVSLGAIASASYEARAFTREDERILNLLANYAVMALENSRLYTNIRRQAEESQTLLSVQNAISSRLDPEAVMQMISDEALRLTRADQTFIYLLEEDNLVLTTSSGVAPVSRGLIVPLRHSITGAAILQRRPIRVDDVYQDRRMYKPIQSLTRSRSLVAVPLASGEDIFGVLVVSGVNTQQFSTDDEHILNLLANNAAISLENANLYRTEQTRRQEAERRRQVAEGLREIISAINASRSFEEVLFIVTAYTCQIFRGDAALFHQTDQGNNTLAIVPYQLSEPVGDVLSLYAGQPALVRPVYIPDLNNIQFKNTPVLDAPPNAPAKYDSNQNQNLRSMLVIPIHIPQVLTGNLRVFFKTRHQYSEEDINIAVIVGDQVALAIENANLRQQAQETAAAAERSRLARDLHDAVTQTLFSASLIAEVLPKIWQKNPEDGNKRLEELRLLTRGASAEMRSLLMELRPNALIEADFPEVLQQLCEAFIGRARIPLTAEIDPNFQAPVEVRVAIYRIAQEALNNIFKHARASQAWLALKCQDDTIELIIQDNGRGFNIQNIPSNHYGLKIMQERADSIQARFEIAARPGSGVRYHLIWKNPQPQEKNKK